MKAAEITDEAIRRLRAGEHRFVRINYPNGDMVGHTGDLEATVNGVQTVDLSLARLLSVVEERGGVALVTADHGNADQMFEIDKKTGEFKLDGEGRRQVRTAHSLNPVPLYFFDPRGRAGYELDPTIPSPGLANIAATALSFLGFAAPEGMEPSLVRWGEDKRG